MLLQNMSNKIALVKSLVLGGIFFMPLIATAQGLTPPPEVASRDQIAVDVISGYSSFTLDDLQIGSGVSSLSHKIATYRNDFQGFRDDYDIDSDIQNKPSNGDAWRIASIGHKTQQFIGGSVFGTEPTTFTPLNGNGATFNRDGAGVYTYTSNDGTIVYIPANLQSNGITYANGRKIINPNGFEISVYKKNGRKQSVVTNTGLQLKYIYAINSLPANPTIAQRFQFKNPIKIIAINNAVEYCDPMADSCSLQQSWPETNYFWTNNGDWSSEAVNFSPIFRVTDAENRVTTYTHSLYSMQLDYYGGGAPYEKRITKIKSNTSAGSFTSTYDYAHAYVCVQNFPAWECSITKSNVVYKANIGSAEWTYSYPNTGTPYRSAGYSNGPNGTHSVVMSTGTRFPRIVDITKPDGIRASFYDNDANNISSATVRGNVFDYVYDARNNLIKVTQRASSGSAEAGTSKVTEAYYPEPTSPNCANLKTCNKPTWVRDAKGNQTDYTYFEEHGGVKTVMLPAPDVGGVRPTTWYKYEQKYAWYKKNGNSIERADTPVWLLTEERTCTENHANVSADTCVDPTKLLITRYNYGSDGVPNNLWKRGVEVISYNKTLRTCYQYDYYGNVIAETQPKAGLSSCQ